MQTIHKRPLPPTLAQGLDVLRKDPTADWKRIRKGTLKRALHQHLLGEQGHLCAYCESRIGQVAGDTQAEHLVPRAVDPALTFEATNLVASCVGKVRNDTPEPPTHCGHVRDRYDPALFVAPTSPEAPDLFDYRRDGAILPNEGPLQAHAVYMCAHLRLGSPRLVAARKAALDTLTADLLDDPADEIARLQQPDPRGHLSPYRSALLAALRRGY